MKQDKDNHHFSNNMYNKDYLNVLEGEKFSKSKATIENLKIGYFIYLGEDWGPGIILSVNKKEGRCLIFWQRIGDKKWHNTFTILGILGRNFIVDMKQINKSSFIIKND